ncbi:MAG: hypothetical protein U9O82_12240 [Thermodesulfobacteriota bacterium]|nr:hypothetical protein [Thermodesulfobacteriota bacterium]
MNEYKDPGFGLILQRLYERYGVKFSQYREGTITRRLDRRIAATGAANYSEYADTSEFIPESLETLLTRKYPGKKSSKKGIFDWLSGWVGGQVGEWVGSLIYCH